MCARNVVVQLYLHRALSAMTEKEQWPSDSPNLFPLKISSLGSDAWSFRKLNLKPKTLSELKVALEKVWDSSLQVQLTNQSRVLETDGESMCRLIKDISSIYFDSKCRRTGHVTHTLPVWCQTSQPTLVPVCIVGIRGTYVKNLARICTQKWGIWESNPRPVDLQATHWGWEIR